MDAVIRFSFSGVDPEQLDPEEYPKIYGQAKYILDIVTLSEAKKQVEKLVNG